MASFPLSLLLLIPAPTASSGDCEPAFLVEAGLPPREGEVRDAIPAFKGRAAAEHQFGVHAVPAPVHMHHFPRRGRRSAGAALSAAAAGSPLERRGVCSPGHADAVLEGQHLFFLLEVTLYN